MKPLSLLKHCALATVLVWTAGTAFAQEAPNPPPTAEELAAEAAYEQWMDAVEDVGANRYAVIAGIVATWEPSMGQNDGWEAEFTGMLQAASDTALLDIQSASSYDAVRAALQGRDAPVSLEGVTGTEELGERTQDLTYAPAFPCRIFDTRNFLGAAPNDGSTFVYYVHGNGALMSPQGGNAAGCFAPKGEPVAVSINIAAVPTSPAGHLRAYPYLGVRPTASFLNYFGGGNIANSGIITTCFGCARDLTIYHRNRTHAFADVMGYFYPAEEYIPSRTARSTSVQADSTCTNITSVLVTIPPDGGYVEVEAHAQSYIWKNLATTESMGLFLDRSSTSCPTIVATDGYTYSFRYSGGNDGLNQFNGERMTTSRIFRESGTGSYRSVRYYVNNNGTDSTANDNLYNWNTSLKATFRPN